MGGYIHSVGPKSVDTSSKLYTPDQMCEYHSNSFGHDTEDCINLKHKIQDLIDQDVVSLQIDTHIVNTNPLLNHGGININMIDTDDDWCITKTITQIFHYELERDVDSLSFKEKKEFMILKPAKVVALVPLAYLVRLKIVIETSVAQRMTRSGKFYTPKELSLGGKKKDQRKRTIREGEAEEFGRKMQPKDYSILNNLEKTLVQISMWALLMRFQFHRQDFMKDMDDINVPMGTSSNNVAAMIN